MQSIKNQLVTQITNTLKDSQLSQNLILATLQPIHYDDIIFNKLEQIVKVQETESQDSLTEKIYNLFRNILDLIEDAIIAHPNTMMIQ